MTFELSKSFHGVGIGPLPKILAVKWATKDQTTFHSVTFLLSQGFTHNIQRTSFIWKASANKGKIYVFNDGDYVQPCHKKLGVALIY